MARDTKVRVGVYLCHCGGNISDVVDVQQVAERAGKLPGVVVARTHMFLCSDPGQQLIREDIGKEGLNRVVVASCSPRLHEQTFRNALRRAGLNPYLYEHANIREQVSWVTHAHPDQATAKAARLVAAAVAKARSLEPLEPIRVDARRHAVVIGGGISGLKAAQELADAGFGVTLIEKSPFLGGHVAQLDRVYPTGEGALELLEPLIQEVVGHPGIEVLTGAEVIAADGYVGNFHLSVRRSDEGVVDEVRAGVVVVATGFDHYEPFFGEFGFGQFPEVVTLPQLIRLMADQRGTGIGDHRNRVLRWNGRPVRSIALIHCVGSRQIEGVDEPREGKPLNEYCSRVCCTATLQVASELRDSFPEVQIFDFYRDIRTYGRGHEDYYEGAARRGILFFRYAAEEPPVVERAEEGGDTPLRVRVKDRLSWNQELEVPVDLVVLAVGMVPRRAEELVERLKLAVGSDGFLLEVHPKLRPVEVAVNGVLLAGTCQGPKDITESAAAASASAAKASALLSKGYVELDPFVATVLSEKCDGCGECLESCSYNGTLSLPVDKAGGDGARPTAAINPALCKGCGACVAACSQGAIELKGWTLEQFDAMVDAICAEEPVGEVVR